MIDDIMDELNALTQEQITPTAPDATAGDGLREALLGALCVDHGHARQEGGAKCRTCIRRVETILALPALRDVLAAAARDAEAIKRVRELAADYDDGSEWGAALYRGDVVRNQIRRALDPS